MSRWILLVTIFASIVLLSAYDLDAGQGVPLFAAQPTDTPTVTPTRTPTVPPTATPTITLTPSPTPTVTPWVMFVVDVGSNGLRVRYSPGGTVMGRIAEDTAVVVLDGPVEFDEITWYRVVSLEDRLEGWVSVEYLAPTLD